VLDRKLSLKRLALFYQNLATMINSGIPMAQALNTMKQGKRGTYYWLLEYLEQKVSQGIPLWQAMAAKPKVFDPFQTMMVKGGEISGTQVRGFQRLAHFFATRNKQRRRLMISLIYPLFLLHAVVLLPPIKYLVLVNLPGSYWDHVLPPLLAGYGLILAAFFIWKFSQQQPKIKRIMDKLMLSLPLIGRLIRDIQAVRFCWILANMLDAGIDMVTAARQGVTTLQNVILKQRMETNLLLLDQGRSVQEYLVACGFYPRDLLAATAVAEEAGDLAASLQRVAGQMDESITQRVNLLLKTVTILAYISAVLIIAWTIISSFLGVMAG
jgi:general secretion pathway protein F